MWELLLSNKEPQSILENVGTTTFEQRTAILENVGTTTFKQRTAINLRKCRNYYFQTKNRNQS
ncbi:hypothetical protein [Leptospira interrogans]|uniref:hypothetical protein n=1 Tax=Leptospira interrogans TaxID=173 RepID=UPI0002BD335A|nr:hypothetical protein [Leptospira interrogans]EMN08627.1 hypothetical protein LEP1GSC053_1812 [Leptospira interrogans serovar Muenchen str. Brem 129]